MAIKLKVLNVFPPLRELEKGSQVIISFQGGSEEGYSLLEVMKLQSEIEVEAKPRVHLTLKQNQNIIGSYCFEAKEEEMWLNVLLDKRISFGKGRIDSIKIKVKCAIQMTNGLNLIQNKGEMHFTPNEGLIEKKKVLLSNLVRDLLKNPLFNPPDAQKVTSGGNIRMRNAHHACNNSNDNDGIGIRSSSANRNNTYHHAASQPNSIPQFNKTNTAKGFRSISQLKKRAENHLSSSGKKKTKITQRTYLNNKQAKTPRNQPQVKRIVLTKKLDVISDEKMINSSTSESIPDNNCNELLLLRQKLEENFNELISKERDLIQNDANILEIEPSISYMMNDLLMDDDCDDINQTLFDNLSEQFKDSPHKEHKPIPSSIKSEGNALLDKLIKLRRLYRVRAKEHQESFVKYKKMFIDYSEKYLQLNQKFAKLKQLNEENKMRVQLKGLFDRKYALINENLVKSNRKEVNLLKAIFGGYGLRESRKQRLSEILGIVLRRNEDRRLRGGVLSEGRFLDQFKAFKTKLAENYDGGSNCISKIQKATDKTLFNSQW